MSNRIGLIASGAVSETFVARLSWVREGLGPVYSSVLRAASRIVHGLRAGYPVAHFDPLSKCSLVLIVVPDDALDATVAAMAGGAVWKNKTVVLCHSSRDSGALASLREQGAQCASLDTVPASGGAQFLAEGDAPAIAFLRRQFGRTRLVVLNPGAKAIYQAGVLLATDAALAITAGAVESLRAAGLARSLAVAVVEALVTHTARSYAKAGNRAAAEAPPPEILAGYAEALRAQDPRLARLFEDAIALTAPGATNET